MGSEGPLHLHGVVRLEAVPGTEGDCTTFNVFWGQGMTSSGNNRTYWGNSLLLLCFWLMWQRSVEYW